MYKNRGLFHHMRSALLITLFLISGLAALQAQSHGDVNSDALVDIVDALLIAQYYVGLNPQNFAQAVADYNQNGTIDIVDALLIAQVYVGLIPPITPGELYNIALNQSVSSDSNQTGNEAINGNDGNSATRWCAADGSTGHWWRVDLGTITDLAGVRITWELTGRVYQYYIDISTDNSSWTTVVDMRSNSDNSNIHTNYFTANARYVRITVSGLPEQTWASFWECEVLSYSQISVPTPAPTGIGGNITIWMAGDSTMANGVSTCPVGYGKMFNTFFDSRVTVVNSARGGRSINTWMYNVLDTSNSSGDCDITLDANGNKMITAEWQAMLTGMQQGDYLIISFGINDGTSVCPRHADEATFKEDMRIMVEAARARGTNPILLTPVSAIICNGSTAQPTRGSYVDYTIAVGQQYNVPVINLHQLSINLYNSLGFCPLPNGASDVSATTGGAVGSFFCDDHTHFDTGGATAIAQLIANAVAAQGLGLADYLK